jgi:putative transposase
VLGLWIERSEGATFWLGVLNDLKNRGLDDVFIFCVDGLKGFPEAIEAVFPQSQVQLCIVHLIRNSLNYVPWKDRKAVAADLKNIYNAANEQIAEQALVTFEQTWHDLYPTVAQLWRRRRAFSRAYHAVIDATAMTRCYLLLKASLAAYEGVKKFVYLIYW